MKKLEIIPAGDCRGVFRTWEVGGRLLRVISVCPFILSFSRIGPLSPVVGWMVLSGCGKLICRVNFEFSSGKKSAPWSRRVLVTPLFRWLIATSEKYQSNRFRSEENYIAWKKSQRYSTKCTQSFQLYFQCWIQQDDWQDSKIGEDVDGSEKIHHFRHARRVFGHIYVDYTTSYVVWNQEILPSCYCYYYYSYCNSGATAKKSSDAIFKLHARPTD